MRCQRCIINEASHRVFSDIIDAQVCTSCAIKALRLELAVEVFPKLTYRPDFLPTLGVRTFNSQPDNCLAI